jgi:hypothetical protein
MAVRAFYADLAAWALEDPARWAVWAAPNPISGRDRTILQTIGLLTVTAPIPEAIAA